MPETIRSDEWLKKFKRHRKLPDFAKFLLQSVGWLSFERRLRHFAGRNRFHVYHETHYVPAAIKDVPQVLTLYDLSLSKFRNQHPRYRVWFSDLFFKRRMKYVSHIITISDFVCSEVCCELGIQRDRVTAIPLAPNPVFHPRGRPEAREIIRNMGLPERFFLFVGTLEPRKNVLQLFKAMAGCKRPVHVVLVGWEGWGDDVLNVAESWGVQNSVFPTGYVDEEDLACLYSNALALVFPSFYEGFGLPVLEAMACGCPVICSNAASLPEVAGDAALLIDPCSVQDLTEVLEQVANDGNLRKRLSEKGLLRSAEFSWRKAAEKTVAVFQQVMDQAKA